MPKNQPISRLATALCTIALAFAPTFLHADSLGFTQTNLVSDVPGLAANTDPIVQVNAKRNETAIGIEAMAAARG